MTTGTRGDTQPYVALGIALQKKGYRVRVAASEEFREFVEQHGLEFAPTRGDISQIATSDLVRDARNADSPLKFFKSMKNPELMNLLLELQHDLHSACSGADAIVYHPGATIGYFVAQELHVPSILATPFPMSPSSDYPALLFYDGVRLGTIYNRLTHRIFEQGFWMMTKHSVKSHWVNTFGQAPKHFSNPFPQQRTASHPTIVSCSPSVFRTASLPAHVHCDGYWFLEADDGFRPPDNLQRFLDDGEPPIYVGFGSIANQSTAAETTAVVLEALKRTGRRGIIATGWGGLEIPNETVQDILFISGAPHHWLFPRMATVVHHGGAGTTAEGLRAGVPQVIIPHGNDQFAWGRRIHELGVGATPIARKRLTVENLAEAILYSQSEIVKSNAKEIGEHIRSEKGAEKAATVITDCVEAFHRNRGN